MKKENIDVTSLAHTNILFPELEKLLPTVHTATSYALLSELPSAKHISDIHLTHLANQLKHDKESDQLALFDPQDPFMGNK